MSINEGASCTLTLTFKDEEGALVVPTSATYRIDDVRTKVSIVEETALSPITSSHDLEITGAQNAILSQTYSSEKHEITVSFIYLGGTKVGKASYILEIDNLLFIS